MFEEGVIASYLVLWHFWLKKNVIKTSIEPKYPCSSLIVQKYWPELFPVIKVIKIHQNHQIQQADFTVMNLNKLCQNCQFHQADLALTNLPKLWAEFSNPLTFTRFHEISSNPACISGHKWITQ